MRDFNSDAERWDTPPRILLAEDIAGAISREIPVTSSMNVLDFGCGTGLVSLAIHTRVGSVTCVDTSKGMIDVLETKIEEQGITNIKAQCVDYLSSEDIAENAFDLAMTSMVLHHVRDIGSCIERFYSSLAPGGYLAIADLDEEGGLFHGDNEDVFHLGFSRERLKEMLAGFGFAELNDITAATVTRPDRTGTVRTFSIFLITGRKASDKKIPVM
jgi:2-polyprenyl-3-methyl-5-hydroxy-6-metoxy-1,4-benzoquinol methylase